MSFIDLPSAAAVSGGPITAFKNQWAAPQVRSLYLMAGVHGDEVEGVYVLKQLIEYLKERPFKLPLVVIPILNVDGHRRQLRVNAHGVDLNRNLPTSTWQATFEKPENRPGEAPLSEPENQFLVSLFEKYPPGFIITFHSWKPILNINGDCLDIANFLHEFNGYPVADDIGYPTPGSLGTYAPEVWDAPVLTFECPRLSEELSLEDIWQQNAKGLKELLDSDLLRAKLSAKLSKGERAPAAKPTGPYQI